MTNYGHLLLIQKQYDERINEPRSRKKNTNLKTKPLAYVINEKLQQICEIPEIQSRRIK